MVDKEKLAQWAQTHANQLFLGGMALLLVLRLGIFLMSGGGQQAAIPDVPEWTPNPILTRDSEIYLRVTRLLQERVPIEQSEYAGLAQHNMFDAQLVRRAGPLVQEAENLTRNAGQRLQQGQAQTDPARKRQYFNDGLRYVEQALDLVPSHQPARQMRQQLQQAIDALDAAEAAPAAGETGETDPVAETPAGVPGAGGV